MQKKKSSLTRITLLYCLFFVVILLCAFISFNEVVSTSKKDAMRMFVKDEAGRVSTLIYDLPIATSQTDFNIPIQDGNDSANNTVVNARASKVDVEIMSGGEVKFSGLSLTFAILMSAAYLAIFILMFMIINDLRRNFKRDGNAFSRRLNMMVRGIGILLVAASLMSSLTVFIESKAVADMFMGSDYRIDTSFRFNLPELLAGIMVFVVAEIISVGNRISEEQKFTI